MRRLNLSKVLVVWDFLNQLIIMNKEYLIDG